MMRSPSDAGYRARRGPRCGRPWGQRLVVLRKAGLFWALWMPPDGQSPRDFDLASARINYWTGYGSVLVYYAVTYIRSSTTGTPYSESMWEVT